MVNPVEIEGKDSQTLTKFQIDRIAMLGRVLQDVRSLQEILDHQSGQPYCVPISEETKEYVQVDETFLRGMRVIALSLFMDLETEGKTFAARMITGLVETQAFLD